MNLAEIQARHDADKKWLDYQGLTDVTKRHTDRAWLLSDRKRLEDQIIGEQTAYNIAATDLENARESILHKDLAIKSLEIINREQETEIRLMREVISKHESQSDKRHYFQPLIDARAALAEFDKNKS